MKKVMMALAGLALGGCMTPHAGYRTETTVTNRLLNAGEIPDIAGLKSHQVYENPYGYVVCDTPEEAAIMFKTMKEANGLFSGYFDRDPGKGIYIKSFDGWYQTANELCKKVNGSWTLLYIASDTIARQLDKNAFKAFITPRIKAYKPGLSDQELEEIVQQCKQEMLKRLEYSRQDANLHELGHVLFAGAYWKKEIQESMDGTRKVLEYATPAPDWLDELSAVLHENLGEDRMAELAELARNNYRDLPPLQQFFATVREVDAEKSGGDSFEIKVTKKDDKKDDTYFYPQCYSFARFMIKATGKKNVFGSIAEADTKGIKFDAWLKQNAALYKLPPTVAKLDQAYRKWLVAQSKKTAKPEAGDALTPVALNPNQTTPNSNPKGKINNDKTTSTQAAMSYTVKAGDTLGKIGSKFGRTATELGAANGIKNLNHIVPGQKLTIPGRK